MEISELVAAGIDAIRDEERTRQAFQAVFVPGDQNAELVIAWLANELGAHALRGAAIVPECVAVYNRFLAQLGVVHELNQFHVAEAMLRCANNNDLVEARRQVKGQNDGPD